MKRILFILLGIFLIGMFSTSGMAGQNAAQGVVVQAGAQYDPIVVYSGAYISDMLFFKTRDTGKFWRRIPHFDSMKRVTCSDALTALQKNGVWKGRLNLKDGSCMLPDGPANWALGNRINFDQQLSELGSN